MKDKTSLITFPEVAGIDISVYPFVLTSMSAAFVSDFAGVGGVGDWTLLAFDCKPWKRKIELAELEIGLEFLGMETNRTKRITNALEYIIMPGLQVTMKYLNMKFEERDREKKGRLKRVKMLVAGG